MPNVDLIETIEDSLTDAVLPEDPLPDEPTESSDSHVEASTDITPEPVEDSSPEVRSPAAKAITESTKPSDDFDKKFGLTQLSPTGKENRIPYSRVKKISEKASKEAVATARADWEKQSTPKITEYETKIKDYEERLGQVAEFEKVMTDDAPRFLNMLSTLPQYKQFFDEIRQLYSHVNSQGQSQTAEASGPPSDMPRPDITMPDGSKVYSEKALEAYNTWLENRAAKLARESTLAEVDKTYGDIRKEFEANRRVQAVIPEVQRQIDQARKWPQFNENENDIVKALAEDQGLSLEGAYQKVVVPKLIADRSRIREDVLKEIKSAPRATSAPSSSSFKPTQSAPTGKRDLEDVIRESIKHLK